MSAEHGFWNPEPTEFGSQSIQAYEACGGLRWGVSRPCRACRWLLRLDRVETAI